MKTHVKDPPEMELTEQPPVAGLSSVLTWAIKSSLVPAVVIPAEVATVVAPAVLPVTLVSSVGMF